MKQRFKILGNKTTKCLLGLTLFSIVFSCSKYLDVVPDNVATIENAFALRAEAQKYLYTCYSYMPNDGDPSSDPAILGGDEIWALTDPTFPEFNHSMFQIAKGLQSSSSPYADGNWTNLYKGLRDCNIFLENVGSVPDLDDEEKKQWIAEVTFLKAYYHFYLVRMYGPIPLIKTNLPIDADVNEVKVYRESVDSCFKYIVQLIDEAKDELPLIIDNPAKMLGRITQPIAYSFKAKVLVTAASPLFNGNNDQITLKNNNGTQLFTQEQSKSKWDSAVVAAKQAIDICQQAGMKLYTYNPEFQQYDLTDTMRVQMGIRNVFTERWNSEIIWANTQSIASLIQRLATPNVDHRYIDNPRIIYELAPPIKIAKEFYSDHGVPIEEDKTRSHNELALRDATSKDNLYIKQGYTTASLNFNREPRYYANLGFDGGIWYGQGRYDDAAPDDLFYVAAKKTQPNGKVQPDKGSVTGYFVKKYVHYQNTQGTGVNDYTITTYPWPIMRLADLYLLYAEALNETGASQDNVLEYVDKVRERAGLKGVKYSWDNYSSNASEYSTQNGRRNIIQQERLIELAFEGQRFWDLRRWKRSIIEQNKSITGWDIEQSTANFYYRNKNVFNQHFGLKDYFWPINDNNILVNPNLVQNIGW
ncbi:Starch-binding associating with outer membrane [bacterium A37T11]|nr:Starch-binding associating with outer membrane [bacterium A37T11]